MSPGTETRTAYLKADYFTQNYRIETTTGGVIPRYPAVGKLNYMIIERACMVAYYCRKITC